MSCRVLGVSPSGYYDWVGRPASTRDQENDLLLKRIKEVHEASRNTYGAPRVTAELQLGQGLQVNHKRVERLMRTAGLQGLYRRKGRRTRSTRPPRRTWSAGSSPSTNRIACG